MAVITGGKVIEGAYSRMGAGAVATGYLGSGDALGALGPFALAGVPGTQFNTIAAKGALAIDYTNAILYINTGTLASNTWTKVGVQV